MTYKDSFNVVTWYLKENILFSCRKCNNNITCELLQMNDQCISIIILKIVQYVMNSSINLKHSHNEPV